MTPQDTPQPPALSRAALGRAAEEREDPTLVPRLRADAETRVVVVSGDRAPVTSDLRLRTFRPAEVTAAADWAFLGRDGNGRALLVAPCDEAEAAALPAPEWASLREVGATLPGEDAAALVAAVAVGRWLRDAAFCSHCGARTAVRASGWARSCPACGREHFPRTDPAVIVAVSDAAGDRLLLGQNAQWRSRNVYSTFAGFVEAGESLEAAILREIEEEAGVRVSDIRYRGSQPWPYPRSLMIGFHATVDDASVARPDGDEIVDVRWFTRAEIASAVDGRADFVLPGETSIARRLIADWAAA
ncbi:NAD(+) diphosphatase [Microbacterium sp. TNHR37B]|uniref:NAD(+) diphosphatase n=1 Tax=Microbacterium sp. TNHR37B TaxID=1775956 RepID=UPI0007B2B9A2|nr:NAD(+) diphosphatase [Microbacterium sp. TNHR37B]KZE91255.1 NADH pyrophosphatase [Microbacterium sp. TNHR37B]